MRRSFSDRSVLLAPDEGDAICANKGGHSFKGRQWSLQPARQPFSASGPDVNFLEAAWASLSTPGWFPSWTGGEIPQPNPIGL